MYLTASSPVNNHTITLSPHSTLAYTQLLIHGQIDVLVGSGADNDNDTSTSAGHCAACSNRSLSHRTAPSNLPRSIGGEIRGPLVPRRRIGRRLTKLLARRIGARGSTWKGLAGCGLGSAHERGSEWYCGIRSLASHAWMLSGMMACVSSISKG